MNDGKTLRGELEERARLWRQMATPEAEDDAAADAAREIYDECAGALERALATHPEAAKVFIVTEQRGQIVTERRYAADSFDADSSGLDVIRDGRVVAAYPGEHTWLSVREDGAEVPDATARALAIARKALQEIASPADDTISDLAEDLMATASVALEDIWTETEG